MSVAIRIENLSKQYRLGLVSTRTLSHDLNRWWKMNIMGKEDPYLKVGEVNDRSVKGSSEYVWALKDINLEVEEGEVLGIIGKNGAGKSTLLKILSKVTAPTTGIIKARGRIASLLEVGTGFHQEMTGRENIFMNGALMGMTRAEIRRKFDEIVDFAGVERYIDTPVKRYSSGMTVRLGFAVAANLEPEILVVDEVLAVGDAEFQKKALGKMHDVSLSEGRTILFVSHNLSAIRQLCSNAIILDKGALIKFGNSELIVTYYQDYSINLSSHISGTRQITLEKLEIMDANYNIIDSFSTFDKIIFTLRFNAKENLDDVTFSISFNNEFNHRVISLWTTYKNKKFNIHPGVFLITFTVPKIHLIPGVYQIITYVESNGMVIERIDNYNNVVVTNSTNGEYIQMPTADQGSYIEEFTTTIS